MAKASINNGERILWTGERPSVQAKGKKVSSFLLFMLLMLLLIGGSLFYVWSRIEVIQLGYEISTALKEERALAETNKKLKLEIATLKSYGRIEKVAVEQLRMIKPKPEQVIVIR